MKHRIRRYITILATAAFCICVFSGTAFADMQGQTDPQADAGGQNVSSEISSAPSEQSPSSASSSSSEASSAPFIPATIQITLIYDNGQQTDIMTYDVYTPVSSLPVPTRDGYDFAGWAASDGTVLSSSEELTEDTTLTAAWTKIVVSSAAPVSHSPASSQKPVDTHQSEVEALASEANEAISDPDALDSQDWSGLFPSSSGSSAVQAAVQSDTGSSPSGAEQTTSGGFSWLFAVGVALIVLALGGIGLFLYLQFFAGPRGGKGGPGGQKKENSGSGIEFTDISSFSGSAEPTSGKDPDMEDTIPIGPSRAPTKDRAGQVPDSTDDDALSSKSQAKPVDGGKNNFDWEKFFDEDDN